MSTFLYILQPSQALALFVGALLGSSLALYFKILEESTYAPILDVSSKEPLINDFELPSTLMIKNIKPPTYHCNVLVVRNKGLRAAEGCKADLKIGDRLLRVCWAVPTERPSATINAQSEEHLDVCAVLNKSDSQDPFRPKRIAPTETGWPEAPRNLGEEEIEGELIISAKNASPRIIKIRILPFEKALDEKTILVIDK